MKRSGGNRDSGRAFIGAVATAAPPYTATQAEAEAFFTKYYSGRLKARYLSAMRAVLSHPSITNRHFALANPEVLVNEDPDNRIQRFADRAIDLSAQAARKALKETGVTTDFVSGLVVNTCTGYICPGISTYLIERLGLPGHVNAYDLVGSGCGGAIPNLKISGSQLSGRDDDVVLSVSVEICSATFQMGNDLSLVLSNALFSDGASAAVIWKRPKGLELISSASRYYPEQRELIRYVHKNGQLHNKLSTSLPGIVRSAVAEVVSDILKPKGLKIGDIRHWALHTGGEKIINGIRDELGLPESLLRPTRGILSRYGNMSSPTVWFVLREILDAGIDKDDWCVMVAFGAGMSAHAHLLRQT
jgi:predicted naringenin-chalcone synthase